MGPFAGAVYPVTNKVSVANAFSVALTLIEGGTLSTTTVTVEMFPRAVAVNPVTNKNYVVSQSSSTVTVIDVAILSTTLRTPRAAPAFKYNGGIA